MLIQSLSQYKLYVLNGLLIKTELFCYHFYENNIWSPCSDLAEAFVLLADLTEAFVPLGG